MPSCKCKRPPGGGGQCGNNQVAICRANDGECHVTCVDIDESYIREAKSGRERNLSILKLLSRELGDEFHFSLLSRHFIRSGTIVSEDGKVIVKYTLPNSIYRLGRYLDDN